VTRAGPSQKTTVMLDRDGRTNGVDTRVRLDSGRTRQDGPARTCAEALYRHRLAAGLSRLELAGRVLCSENYIYRLVARSEAPASADAVAGSRFVRGVAVGCFPGGIDVKGARPP
jgi:hypothetical protein